MPGTQEPPNVGGGNDQTTEPTQPGSPGTNADAGPNTADGPAETTDVTDGAADDGGAADIGNETGATG